MNEQPAFNHSREDGPHNPCIHCAKMLITNALREMGVTGASNSADRQRWSVTDLATDLSPKLLWLQNEKLSKADIADAKAELLDYLLRVAVRTDGSEVWRALFAEMRSNLLERPK